MATAEVRGKKKMRIRFNTEEDRIIIHEVYSLKAYCTPGRATSLFKEVAKQLNSSEHCQEEVSGKQVQDRFTRLVKNWRTKENKMRAQTGIGEDITDEDTLMCSMVAAIDDLAEDKQEVREAEKLKQEKQKKVDASVIDYAMNRKKSKAGPSTAHRASESFSRFKKSEKDDTVLEETRPRKKSREETNHTSEFSELIAMMEASDAVDKEKSANEIKDRAAQREHERNEREKDREMRLNELKTVMDTFAKLSKK